MKAKPLKKRGPKPLYDGVPMTRKQVTIDEMTERKLKVLGKGNLSAAIRHAADIAFEAYQRNTD